MEYKIPNIIKNILSLLSLHFHFFVLLLSLFHLSTPYFSSTNYGYKNKKTHCPHYQQLNQLPPLNNIN